MGMTIDEVNEKFPLTKYKAWVSQRAREGLPTAGGVDASASRANSLRDAEGILPAMADDCTSFDRHSQTNATTNADTTAPDQLHTAKDEENEKRDSSGAATEPATVEAPRRSEADDNSRPELQRVTSTSDDQDDDDHIDAALPPDALQAPGDACAICIEPLEDDEDIRGLTCGHAFHAGCVDPWLTSRRACCPLCKADYYVPKPRPTAEQEAQQATFDARANSRLNLPARLTNVFRSSSRRNEAQQTQETSRTGLGVSGRGGQAETTEVQTAPTGTTTPATTQQTPEVTEQTTPATSGGMLSSVRSAMRFGRRRNQESSEPTPANNDVTPSQLESGTRPTATT